MEKFGFFTCWRLAVLIIALTVVKIENCCAQNITVVSKIKIYAKEVTNDPRNKMFELKCADPSFVYDLAYARIQNFTGKKLYRSDDISFLRRDPAMALKQVQSELSIKGLGLKIFDAYRPYSVTKKMWELIHDERYVANPAKGSGHNRGLSVDLTLIDLKTGSELNMGTAFDNFTDTAHHNFLDLDAEILNNRKLLRTTMEKYGFKALETEWWHYSWKNDPVYSILDIEPKKLLERK